MMKQEFLDQAQRFRGDLERASGWDEIRALWGQSFKPYRIAAEDPLSSEYRLEVLDLYERLTGLPYELNNEMSSTKVSPSDFERGYPWMTNDLRVGASEMAKTVQVFRVLQDYAPAARRIIEFGVGWGNLTLALAQIGRSMTAVDIDAGFVARTEELAQRSKLEVQMVNADFLSAARAMSNDFDVAIFQSSFHHCLDFAELLQLLRKRVLAPGGRVFFFSEPIFPNYPFPWGLRTDGESLWAITMNKWCELGFDHDFFAEMLHANGFFGTATGAIPGLIGDAWVATPTELGLAFADWALPTRYDNTFHQKNEANLGRFLRERSVLPVPTGSRGKLTFANYGRVPLTVAVMSGQFEAAATIAPDAEAEIVIEPGHGEMTLRSSTFVPDEVYGTGDIRRVGVALKRVEFAWQPAE